MSAGPRGVSGKHPQQLGMLWEAPATCRVGLGLASGQLGTCVTIGLICGDRGMLGPALEDELADGPRSLVFVSGH